MNKNLILFLKTYYIYIVFLCFLIGVGIYLLVPQVNVYMENKQNLATKQETFDNLQRELDLFKEVQAKKIKEAELEKQKQKEKLSGTTEKSFFLTTIQSGDSFSANAPLLEDIIRLLKSNNLKLVSIENKTSGFEDEILKNSADKYNICMISMQLLGSYPKFQKFLTHLYDYPYLINIDSINVIPYDKDKKTLIINLSIVLYSETVQDTTSQENNN